MRIVSVVGARPQFVKLAPVAAAAARAGVDHYVVHTGQHYDPNMSQAFFDELGMAAPDINLEIGSASHGVQTGRILAELEPVLEAAEPDWVLAYGDTNSTLAAAVAATKLHIPLAHLEAGLRSFNRRMPEEHNRVLTDHAADLCLAPSQIAMGHLAAEGLSERAVLVGDVMADVLRQTVERVELDPVQSPVEAGRPYVVATVHRPDNTDDPDRLASIIAGLAALDARVFLAAHPRLVAKASAHGVALAQGAITPVPPLSYPQLVQAVRGATAVVTDSGGLQKEAFLLAVPTTTLRAETEWVETLAGGWNELVTDARAIGSSVHRPRPEAPRGLPYGDGHAADATLTVLIERAKDL